MDAWLQLILALPALIAAVFLGAKFGRRGGRKEERRKAKQKDIDHAEDIRRRVDAGLDGKLRDHADRGYRD